MSGSAMLEGRVAVVTGAGRGIGREIARCLASEGASVVVNDVGAALDGSGATADPASETCALIEEAGGKAVPNGDSVADFEGAGRIVGQAVETFGSIDILVNNAGIVRDRTLLKMSEDDYDAVIAVHQKGTFNCTRHAAAHMRAAGYGRIVNITSSAGLRGNFGQTNYGAAKAAIMGMTFVWALELGRYGITVNAVAPAGLTRMTENLFGGREAPPEQNPALNAPLVAFLASEEAGWVNGQVLGRTGFAYTIFQTPRQVAAMWRDGGWTPAQVAEHFHEVLGQHLQSVGMPAHPLLGAKDDKGSPASD
ncbi:MAG TPA: SDR family NAD(P)-dependent oxidoreductase [Acidimicrobiales bacterium]|nr:SDR family NAD(P)-dependent oxidoreductase [Acidimicrobiales bacterium]